MANEPAELLRAFLQSLDLDESKDPELGDTPHRVTELYRELFAGLHSDPPTPSTFLLDDDQAAGDPVVIAALPFYSMCVHHLLPFFGFVDVAYVPQRKMVGFGSVGRIVDHFARRPQVQERLVAQIADHLQATLQPQGLLVRLRARQLCMEMRGARKRGELISLAARGCLRNGERRAELLAQFDRAKGDFPQ